MYYLTEFRISQDSRSIPSYCYSSVLCHSQPPMMMMMMMMMIIIIIIIIRTAPQEVRNVSTTTDGQNILL